MFKINQKKTKNNILKLMIIFVTIAFWSIILGGGIAMAFDSNQPISPLKSVDAATGKFQIGEELYLENCSGCHIPIPPAVLPRETWQTILENPSDHYGVKVEGIIRLTQVLMWDYISNYSRNLMKDEAKPDYIAQSRYFKALHPKVNLPDPITHRSCVSCHPKAIKFDYRTIEMNSPE